MTQFKTRLNRRLALAIAAAGLVSVMAWGDGAKAQNRITSQEAIQSLNSTAATATRIGIDTVALRDDIVTRIKAEGTENSAGDPPVLDVLKGLPTFIVQVQFDLDSDWLRPESWVTVARIADALHHPLLAGNRFLIVGHTDARGDRLYNLELSERRALSVAEILISTFQVDPNMLVVTGLGEEQLFNRDSPDDGVNRRVEFINIGPQ